LDVELSHELRDSYTSFFLVPVLILDLFWNPKPGQGEGTPGARPDSGLFHALLTTSRRDVEQNPTLLMVKTLITTVASVEFQEGAEQFVRLNKSSPTVTSIRINSPSPSLVIPTGGPLRHNFARKRGA